MTRIDTTFDGWPPKAEPADSPSTPFAPIRPEWVKCIKRNRVGNSWCGRPIHIFEWTFGTIEHAIENGMAGGSLVTCPKCAAAVREALARGLPKELT